MAFYEIAYSDRTVQPVSQTKALDVQLVGFYTKPDNVLVEVLVPYAEYEKGNEAEYVKPVAVLIETIFRDGFISGARFVQDIDASKLLSGFVDFTVSYTSGKPRTGPLTSVVRVPVPALESQGAFHGGWDGTDYGLQIAKQYSRLVALSKM